MTALYAILHILVDGVCALAMFGSFLSSGDGYGLILIYNFCAFAMQMPCGVLLDVINAWQKGREPEIAFAAAAVGVCCTIAGAVTHPLLLGMGNALFHLGGGIGTIQEDHARHWEGRGLGVFVAPGAIGLYFGTWIAKRGVFWPALLGVGIVMALLCMGAAYLLYLQKQRTAGLTGISETAGTVDQGNWKSRKAGVLYSREDAARLEASPYLAGIGCAACCLAVVILRSYLGMAVTFPWKTSFAAGLLAVLALAGGKAAGGFLAARYGFWKTSAVSLFLAAFCYGFPAVMPLGLLALFCFNITMPVTLYWMVCMFPRTPGFAFGYLTFGLFLGFLPGYFGMLPQESAWIVGSIGSLLSIAILLCGANAVPPQKA